MTTGRLVYSVVDFSLVASISTAEATGHSLAKYPKTTAYLTKCKTLVKDYEESNGKGAGMFADWVNSILKDLPK